MIAPSRPPAACQQTGKQKPPVQNDQTGGFVIGEHRAILSTFNVMGSSSGMAIIIHEEHNGTLRLEYFSKFIGLSKKIIDKSFAMS